MKYLYTLPTGAQVRSKEAFTHDGVAYPRAWLDKASPEWLAEFGITKAALPDTSALPAPTPVVDLEALRRATIENLKGYFDEKSDNAVVFVPSLGVSFGLDYSTRLEIGLIVSAVAAEKSGLLPAGTTPNPRPFTPKGMSAVALSHEAFALVNSALNATKDAYVAAYHGHKAALQSLTTAEEIAAYDYTTGWPNG